MPSDEQLMVAVSRGDHEAFRDLYDRHHRGLFAFIARYAGQHDADDIFQETWLRVAKHAPRFDPARRFTTWLFQIAVNLCHDWHRRRARAAEPIEPASPSEPSCEPEVALDAAKLLTTLAPPHRAVLVLRYFHDLSEAEIAAILEIPRGTVKSRTAAALSRLRALTADE